MSAHYPEPVFDDAVDAAAAKAKAEAERREAARLRFRAEFPEVTAFADMFRAKFGEQVRVVWAIENGGYVGKPPQKELQRYETDGIKLRPVRLTNEGDSN